MEASTPAHLAHQQDINIHIPVEALVDPEQCMAYANKLIELQKSLLTPSSIGFCFTSHQVIELNKLLLSYRADASKFEVFGSDNPKEALAQQAALAARIELLQYLLSRK